MQGPQSLDAPLDPGTILKLITGVISKDPRIPITSTDGVAAGF